MKQNIRNWIAALFFVTTAGGATLTLAAPQTAFAACNDSLLTIPAWFQGLTNGDCSVKSPADAGGLPKFIWHIGLNILEAMLQIVGYVSVGFIIKGGFKYMTSSGDSSGMANARTTILNAVVGLGISIFSVAIVNVVAGAI
jgi:hypothetical protein